MESNGMILNNVFVNRDGIGYCLSIERARDDFMGANLLLCVYEERIVGVVGECISESGFKFSGYERNVLVGEKGRENKS
jgi:hypothetical protein